MTLDTAVLHSEEATEVFDNCDQSDMKDEIKFSDIAQDPPVKRTSVHQLLLAQQEARDALSKFISVIFFSVEKLEAIQSATATADQLYCQLIQVAHPGKRPEELPSFPLLAKTEVDRCRSSVKYQPRVGLRHTQLK